MTYQKITNEGNAHKYFHMMLNMAEDDLDPFQYRLLAHYVRWTGHGGVYEESLRQTSQKVKMSVNTVQKVLDQLVTMGYLNVERPEPIEARKGKMIEITVIDRWQENVNRFVSVSDTTQPIRLPVSKMTQVNGKPVSDMTQQTPKAVSNLTRLEEQNTEEQIQEKDSTPVPDVSPFDAFIENELKLEPVAEKPKPAPRPAKKQKEPDAYDLAIAKVWDNSASGFLTQVKGMMFGCGKKGSTWEDCNFNPPVDDPAEIERFGVYMARRMKTQDIRIRPTAAVVIQRWFYDFRTEEKRKAAVVSKAAQVPEVSDSPEVTAQQRRALLDAMKTTRPVWEQVETTHE